MEYYIANCLHCYKSDKWDDCFRIHVHEKAYYRLTKCGGRAEIISYKGKGCFKREFICMDVFKHHFCPTGESAGQEMSEELTWSKYVIYSYIEEDARDIGTIPVPSFNSATNPAGFGDENLKQPISSNPVFNPYNNTNYGYDSSYVQKDNFYTPFNCFNVDLFPKEGLQGFNGSVDNDNGLPDCGYGTCSCFKK